MGFVCYVLVWFSHTWAKPGPIMQIKNNGASTPMFTAALSIIAKVWKKPKCPSMDDCIKKMWYIYNGVLLGNQREWNLAICNNMDGTRVYYAKQNKSVMCHSFVKFKKHNRWT